MLAGCSTWPERPPLLAAAQEQASLGGLEGARFWADAPTSEWRQWRDRVLQDRARSGARGGFTALAISSGSDRGAFAAGYVSGWSARGDRPVFTLVTGVSTGALVAPFAFLGAAADDTLRSIYTGVTPRDIYRARLFQGLFGGPSLADSRPLERLIASHVDEPFLDRIAAEHRKGRRLLVLTTNLDAQRGVVWDMGAIATSAQPYKLNLFRKVLLASASIPGVFPPVLIETASPDGPVTEMHVDGGTTSSVFIAPLAAIAENEAFKAGRPGAPNSLTVLYNGYLAPQYEVVRPRTFAIMLRALDTMIAETDRRGLDLYRRFASERGGDFCVQSVRADFDAKPKVRFDRTFMTALFNYGETRARIGRCDGAEEATPRQSPRGR